MLRHGSGTTNIKSGKYVPGKSSLMCGRTVLQQGAQKDVEAAQGEGVTRHDKLLATCRSRLAAALRTGSSNILSLAKGDLKKYNLSKRTLKNHIIRH